MSRGPVLIIPACEPGRGGGHLARCGALARGLRELGREAWLYPSALCDTAGLDQSLLVDKDGLRGKNWECIVLDRFQTPPEELDRWLKIAPVIGIDEGGACRNNFDFLIDILPNIESIKPNISDVSLLPLPPKPAPKKNTPGAPLKILVSFGQEDAARLGPAAAQALTEKNTGGIFDITLLQKGVKTLPNLSEHLCEYDLVITHYGITAFEALYAGAPVILISPTPYHEKLAKTAGFYSLGVGKGRAKKLSRRLLKKGALQNDFFAGLKSRCAALAARHNLVQAPRQSLANLIDGFAPSVSCNCIVCGSAADDVCGSALRGPALARFGERTYRRCARCGTIVMNRLTPPPIEYAREYFFDFYQQQYGKTYIEDFPNLIAMAKRRLAVIKPLLSGGGTPRLLDIGCAYGPFLAAAREEGFSPQGIDPAEDAVRYVTQTLGIPAAQGFFPNPQILQERSFDVITLWYVIEHFRDCVPALAEVKKLLNPGGVLAFATPSYSGVSGRCSLKGFLERSPADHWTVWSPAACKKALKKAGFTVRAIKISGHHPERFPLVGRFARSKKSPLYGALLALSVIFKLGDTFEVYATAAPSE